MSPDPYAPVHDPLVSTIAAITGVILIFLQPLARWMRRFRGSRPRTRQ